MRALRYIPLFCIALAVASGALAADQKTGLPVGTKAPTFTLKDQNAKVRSLDELLKKGRLALVFYRSAGW